ncbi:perlucin-like protein isoform X2 [Pomacea canaliculata]|uniref:perlucin-like protein isoform X2 n=1 Tax=Pomacea canaliculata TaxID=400727 RepID=UPI000D73523A|nr:perlucin-like protein isoform X2 [Pomacea canaliculata]
MNALFRSQYCSRMTLIRASDSCPASSDVSYGSSCYYYHSESKTWDMAQKACEAEGGVLTSLNSETEVEKVLDGIRDMGKRESVADYWIGLTNQGWWRVQVV